ncbi:DUF302 domain-containing protein [Acidisoma cellulosilytica]|uniref:DUF302 domain-containing protein n=1 Tax=Acidisoma cellulosilyticum TaxID=2802395 RepID=A0A964E5R0_9PROT|nr:DUF302 domain-containing protein [Acidisoma cellulosilyticum]MCB8882794.1 DUF302 domain-containing protein [Acidisoma cellulosilyticum]
MEQAEDLEIIVYAAPSSPSFQTIVLSAFDFEQTLDRLKQAIAAHDLWLIQEINPQMLLARGGYAIAPARQLFFFHARYVARMLTVDPAALPEIPLKFVVMQMPDGSVSVRYCTVDSLLGRYPGLADLASELDAIVGTLIDAIR